MAKAKEIPALSRVQYTSLKTREKVTGILFCYALTGARTTALLLPDDALPKRCTFIEDFQQTLYGVWKNEDERECFEARQPESLSLIDRPEQILEELLTHRSSRVRAAAKGLMGR